MKQYKHITILETEEAYDNKPVYDILNNKSGDSLGLIFYYKQWKKYVFTQTRTEDEIIFDNSCLRDIVDFLENETTN